MYLSAVAFVSFRAISGFLGRLGVIVCLFDLVVTSIWLPWFDMKLVWMWDDSGIHS